MKLIDLEPQFLRWLSETRFGIDVTKIFEADGIWFLCPQCFKDNANSRPGVHGVICWQPHIDQNTSPVPGRWQILGTGYHDLTLRAGSSSVQLNGGCNAHFYIENGIVRFC